MRIGFALEHSLGHITHAQNLKAVLASDAFVSPVYCDLPFDGMPGAWAKLPLVRSNWSVRASLGAYLGLRRQALDAALFHTQVTSLFSPNLMRRVPSVISLDATPIQYDAMGAVYGHIPGGNPHLETLKKRLNVRAFGAARHLVTWSEWTKQSLIADYNVAPEKVTVIPPGIDTKKWNSGPREKNLGEPVRFLFVGGDFSRKGGDTLLESWKSLPAQARCRAHLDIVTRTEGDLAPGQANITIHRNVAPNSALLQNLFAHADAFVFPTRGDCLPLAVLEAMAAGVPVITTGVGALGEAVTDGESGFVVPVGDAPALASAIENLLTNSERRESMGRAARAGAVQRFDAHTNYGALVSLVKRQGAAR